MVALETMPEGKMMGKVSNKQNQVGLYLGANASILGGRGPSASRLIPFVKYPTLRLWDLQPKMGHPKTWYAVSLQVGNPFPLI